MENWETGWSRDVLERIVVLLFSLANLADRAAGASFRRRRVLAILNHGEAEARAFLFGMAADAPTLMDTPERTGDAARLAVRLRALALVICAMLAQVVLPEIASPQDNRQKHELSGPTLGWLGAASASPAPDT